MLSSCNDSYKELDMPEKREGKPAVKFDGFAIASVYADIAPPDDSGKVFSEPFLDPPDPAKIFPDSIRAGLKWARQR